MSVKIFLSTVSDEFRDYRDQLRSDLTRHNVEVKVQEDFKDYGGVTLDKLDLYISTCDAVVHLVGNMTGSDARPASITAIVTKYPNIAQKLPPLRELLDTGFGISYTQWEAWLALYHGKALLIATADDAAPRGAKYLPTDASRAAQQAHLKRLRTVERYPGFTFTGIDNLAKQIAYTAILDLLASQHRGNLHVRSGDLRYAVPVAAFVLLLLAAPAIAERLSPTIGLALAASISLFIGIFGLALCLIYWRDLAIVGASTEPVGSAERRTYDALRENLAVGGLPARLYSRWLGRFLAAVDRFFGDGNLADQKPFPRAFGLRPSAPTLFPRAFGLTTPAPLWTAPAFDRCLLLALIYPLATILIIWAMSGHVGPAEAALGLKANLSGWRRGLAVVMIGLSVFAAWDINRIKGPNFLPWLAIAVVAGGAFGGAFAGAGALACVLTVAVAIGGRGVSLSGVVAISFAFAVAIAVAVGTFTGSLGRIALDGAVAFAFVLAGSVPVMLFKGIIAGVLAGVLAVAVIDISAGAGAAAFAGAGAVAILDDFATEHRWQGLFLPFFVIGMTSICLCAANLLSPLETWEVIGSWLLFLGLLTLIKAPFDWISVGLTRALLRRGLELGGWCPFFLALVDALLAAVTVAFLALTMVIGVQAFDGSAEHGGGGPVLPLGKLFDGIAANPAAPEYWWVYALLLSTMIPSVINLVIGGVALTRGLPGLSSLLLRFMPADEAVLPLDRAWIAAVLTAQVAIGTFLGITAQALLAVGLIGHVMPWLGLGLLDMARDLANLNLPMRMWRLFEVTLQWAS